jgi:hypothetical protein
MECVKVLISRGAHLDLVLEHGYFITAHQAAEAALTADEMEKYLDPDNGYDEEALRRDKAEAAEILRQHSSLSS